MRSPGVSIWTLKVFRSQLRSDPSQMVRIQVKDFDEDQHRIDISALSSEFKQQYSGLISGSGTVNCNVEYEIVCDARHVTSGNAMGRIS